ncbi:MAG: cell wall hydrolase [Pseudomonadota bacterium]
MNGAAYRHIPEVNWTSRSLLAATGFAVCLLMSAFGAAASTKQMAAMRAAEKALANEAEIVAALADHLAAETANLRAATFAPSLKPATTLSDVMSGDDTISDLLALDTGMVPATKAKAAESKCLAQAIYYEARSESRIGQLAVADVVLNRVASRAYPSTICGVVFQGSHRRTGCQFSFTCDGSMDARLNTRLWRQSELLAAAVLSGMRLPVSREATHYHANYVSPKWAAKMTPTAVIGKHKFYRFRTRRSQPAAPVTM